MPENDSDSDDDRTIFAICSAALNEAALTDDPHLLHLQALERELAAKTVQLADCEARLRACAGPALVFRCIGTQTGDAGSEIVAAGRCTAASVAAPAAKRRLPTTRGSTAASCGEAPPGPPPCSSGRSTPNPPKLKSKRDCSLDSRTAQVPPALDASNDSILRRLGDDPSLTIMHMVVRQAQLETSLSSNKAGWSLFTPTDDAFLKLQGVAAVQALLASNALCAQLTLHHLCDSAVPNANGWFRSGSSHHIKVKSLGAVPPPLPLYFEGEPASVGRVLREASVGSGRLFVCDSVLWLPRELPTDMLTMSNVAALDAAHREGLKHGDDCSESLPYSDSGLDLSYLTADCDLTWGQAPDVYEELIDDVELGSESTEWATLLSGENTNVQSTVASPERGKEKRAALNKSTPKALHRSIKKLEKSSKAELPATPTPAVSADERQALKLAKWTAKLEEYQRQSLGVKGARK